MTFGEVQLRFRSVLTIERNGLARPLTHSNLSNLLKPLEDLYAGNGIKDEVFFDGVD